MIPSFNPAVRMPQFAAVPGRRSENDKEAEASRQEAQNLDALSQHAEELGTVEGAIASNTFAWLAGVERDNARSRDEE
jgi:hypothetical protein